MKRSLLLRTSALWAALLLVLTWGADGIGLHACPHHDMVAAAQSGHMAHGQVAHAGHGRQAPQPEHQACTCIGCCHAGTAAVVPQAAALAVRAAVAGRAAAPLPRGDRALPSSPPYLLPYSTAPPRLA
ncbi:MAG TPA: hypothetical protein VFH27_09560 [Longimicrobiaceae bacterium]|nr:hypothetical protein [Longimicrobiaceae bacterium]